MGRLDERVAVVTGASRGLGKAIAVAMAREGASVAVVARTEHQWHERLPGTIGETVAEIEALGGRAVAIRADLSDRNDRSRLVEEARAAFGPVSVLVNNAAFTVPGRPPAPGEEARPADSRPRAQHTAATPRQAVWPTFRTTPLGAYERHFAIGPFASYELMQLVLPDMVDADQGWVVNITSVASRTPGDGPYSDRRGGVLPGYGSSKAALEHLTRCVAYESAGHNIAVNALAPSRAILTPGTAYYAMAGGDDAHEEDFAEATVRLATVDPALVTGKVIGHDDVLNGSFRAFQ